MLIKVLLELFLVIALVLSLIATEKATVYRFYEKKSTDDVPTCTRQTVIMYQHGGNPSSGETDVDVIKKITGEVVKGELSALERRLESKFSDMIPAVHRKDCNDVANQGYTSNGIYMIFVQGKFVEVYCDLESDGGSWLVFQRRNSGEVDFFLNWTDYKTGFGNKSKEFWLGLDNLHAITSSGSYKLRVDLEDWEGNTAYAEYSTVTVGNASTNYLLTIGSYTGTAGDSMTSLNNNRPFSTKDNDHDPWEDGNCAIGHRGAWWFGRCSQANLNGEHFSGGPAKDYKGIRWDVWKGFRYSMKKTEMKVRRI